MQRAEKIGKTDRLVLGFYIGYAISGAVVIVAVTLVTGFGLHTLVAKQTAEINWTSPIGVLSGFVRVAVITGIGLLAICLFSRVVSTTTDKLFARSLDAPDGRKLTGGLGLLATLVLSAIWMLPLWNSLLPALTATAAEAAPHTLPGNTRTFITVIPGMVALYGYFTATGDDYTLPEDPEFSPQTDLPHPSSRKLSMPRTTKITPSPNYDRGNRDRADTSSNSNNSEAADSGGNDGPMDYPTPNDDESSDEGTGPATTNDSPGSSVDSQVEFEREIQEYANSETKEPAAKTREFVDLTGHQFDWMTETNVTMDEVGGMEDIKEELRQDVIKPMRDDPERAERFDIPLPNVLLYGPPGTGKTYLAKALATELEFPFVNLSGSDVTSKWVNESSERVAQLFDEAENIAGSVGGAVIFLDELDAVLPERQMDSNEEDRKVVNEFLSHLQESARRRVLFIGATNKRDDLDSAAVRSGRIDKEILVGEPDHKARVEIFKAQLDSRPHSLSENELEELAAATEGVVAADIETIVNQAARNAAYGRDADQVEFEDISLQINK